MNVKIFLNTHRQKYYYRCVAAINCNSIDFNENSKASCPLDDHSSGRKVCCKEEDILMPQKPCSEFKDRR